MQGIRGRASLCCWGATWLSDVSWQQISSVTALLHRSPGWMTSGRLGWGQTLKLFTHAVVAIDGSKFKAVNNRDNNYMVAKVTGRMEQVEASIARYLRALDQADREESDIAEAKSVRLKQKIAGLRQQMQALKVMEQTVPDAPDLQVSLTDPNARSMATSGKATATVGPGPSIRSEPR